MNEYARLLERNKQLHTENERLQGQIKEMIEKAAAKYLPAYREQGAKMAAQAQEITELKAYVERLRDAIFHATCDIAESDIEKDDGLTSTHDDLVNAIKETPAKSFQAIKTEVEEGVIELCADICADRSHPATDFAERNIRNMPRKYSGDNDGR